MQEKYDLASFNFSKAHNINPNSATLLTYMAKNYQYMKNYEKAMECFKEAEIIDPKNQFNNF